MADEATDAPPAEGGDNGAAEAEPAPAAAAVAPASDNDGPQSLKAVFLGNLTPGYRAEDVTAIFSRPQVPPSVAEGTYAPVPVDRIDLKRGYCFVFLKDAANMAEKESTEQYVSAINGM